MKYQIYKLKTIKNEATGNTYYESDLLVLAYFSHDYAGYYYKKNITEYLIISLKHHYFTHFCINKS